MTALLATPVSLPCDGSLEPGSPYAGSNLVPTAIRTSEEVLINRVAHRGLTTPGSKSTCGSNIVALGPPFELLTKSSLTEIR